MSERKGSVPKQRVVESQPREACIYSSFPDDNWPLPVSSTYTLYPWTGRYVAILTKERDLDPATMRKILRAVDSAYVFYRQLTGRTPEPYFQYNGLLSIAEVARTCRGIGAGCGELGITGIELTEDAFKSLYEQVLSTGEFDQTVFYELGRNFWFYGPQFEKVPDPARVQRANGSSFEVGFAIWGRFQSMKAAQIRGAPFRPGMDFETFKRSILIDLLRIYSEDPDNTWRNTLDEGLATKDPKTNPNGWGDADLVAAILDSIAHDGNRRDHDGGRRSMRAFWQTAGKLPAAGTPDDVMMNFLRAGKAATSKDYRILIRDNSLPAP
jgi:serralysin